MCLHITLILFINFLEDFLSFATKTLSGKLLRDVRNKLSTQLPTVNVHKPQEAAPYPSAAFFGNVKE